MGAKCTGPSYGNEKCVVVLKYERSQGRLSIRINGGGPVYTVDGVPAGDEYWPMATLFNQGDKLRVEEVKPEDHF